MLDADKPIVSIHIPKTAGLALAQFYEDLFGPDNVRFFYDNRFFRKPQRGTEEIELKKAPARYRVKDALLSTSLGSKLARHLRRYIVNPPPLLKDYPTDFKILHGHFRIDPEDKDKYNLVTVLREPMARTTSLFRYLREQNEGGHNTPAWYSPSMPFEDFAAIPQNRNVYARYLNNLSLSDFRIVGITEDLESYCRVFEPQMLTRLRRVNRSSTVDFQVSAGFARHFRKVNASDFEIYAEAKDRAKQLISAC